MEMYSRNKLPLELVILAILTFLLISASSQSSFSSSNSSTTVLDSNSSTTAVNSTSITDNGTLSKLKHKNLERNNAINVTGEKNSVPSSIVPATPEENMKSQDQVLSKNTIIGNDNNNDVKPSNQLGKQLEVCTPEEPCTNKSVSSHESDSISTTEQNSQIYKNEEKPPISTEIRNESMASQIVTGRPQPIIPKQPPVAKIDIMHTLCFIEGNELNTLSGKRSIDPDGGEIKRYEWSIRSHLFAESPYDRDQGVVDYSKFEFTTPLHITPNFNIFPDSINIQYFGRYPAQLFIFTLKVTDDEGDSDYTRIPIFIRRSGDPFLECDR